MKNSSLLFLLITFTFSCKTKEEKLISNAESYIKDSVIIKINDPDSYKLVSTQITDSIKLKTILISDGKYLHDIIMGNDALISLYKTTISLYEINQKSLKRLFALSNYSYYSNINYRDEYNDNIIKINEKYDLIKERKKQNIHYQKLTDSLSNVIKNVDTSQIALISIKQVYRYKNTLGGVMLDTANVFYANQNLYVNSIPFNFKKGFNHVSKIVPLKSFRIN
jgi:hypothetical protein